MTRDLRWHVCCRACRAKAGSGPGGSGCPCCREDGNVTCLRCEERTRETFGDPHPDDWGPP